MPRTIVDSPAVVWVNQIEFPDLISLINIGNARRGQPDQHLRETVEHAEIRDSLLEGHEICEELIIPDDRLYEPVDPVFIRLVLTRPARALFGFAKSLDHVIAHP